MKNFVVFLMKHLATSLKVTKSNYEFLVIVLHRYEER